jgi:hypothetical protein
MRLVWDFGGLLTSGKAVAELDADRDSDRQAASYSDTPASVCMFYDLFSCSVPSTDYALGRAGKVLAYCIFSWFSWD